MDKKRRFELPGYQDLSKEQDDALALPKDGLHLVVGGPGTGKSVVTLLRTLRHKKDQDPYLFLVYNHLLHHACCEWAGTDINSRTWKKWFFKLYYDRTRQWVPTLEAASQPFWKPIDWDAVLEKIHQDEALQVKNPPVILIDEGQDMPPRFYEALLNMGFDKFFVVADQNQQIDPDHNSSRQDLEDHLGLEPEDVIDLTQNYRNTHEIARLARHFYTDIASEPPTLPPSSRKSPKRPLLYEYRDDEPSFDHLVSRILKTADVRPNRLVGVICPDNQIREKYYNHILEMAEQKSLDNGPPAVGTYPKGKKVDLRFDRGGIMVINQMSCKGLEFDYVFLADIDRYPCRPGDADAVETLRKKFYVMVTRAREHLVMLKVMGRPCPVDEYILPQDETILQRERQNG